MPRPEVPGPEAPARGVFVAFEGGEGSGKSTQAALLAERVGAVLTREPGGTALGRRIRTVVLDPGASELAPRAEALLMLADRAQHVAEVVVPALERGDDVITDRFSGSTLAYQGWGRRLGADELRTLSSWASSGLEPDLVVLLDVDPGTAMARLDGPSDRLESAGEEFHLRVTEGYRALASADPGRWVVVDGSGTVDETAAAVFDVYSEWRVRMSGGQRLS